MKIKIALLALSLFVVMGCKDLKDMNGTYDITTVGDNDYSSYDITLQIEMGEEMNRISGKSACNQYSGSFENPEVNQVQIGPLMSTKMYCAQLDSIERDYMNHLNKVTQVTVDNGELLLLGQDGSTLIKGIKRDE
jgi:heat shock protein HslJ